MKNLKGIFCCIIGVVLTFGMFAGCKKDSVKYLHDIKVSMTDKYIVRGGLSDYKIIISGSASTNTAFAAGELSELLKASAGVNVSVMADTGVTFNESAKFLSIGINSYSQSAGIVFDYSVLKDNGVRIITKGNSVFMGGATHFGDINSVYKFLEHTIGFEAFTADVVIYDTSGEVPLLNFDVTDVPDIQWRVGTHYSTNGSSDKYNKSSRRLLYNRIGDVVSAPTGWISHNTFEWLPKAKYLTNVDPAQNHGEWYSDDGLQLCYTAHGSGTEYDLMIQTLVERAKQVVKERPFVRILSFTHEDYGGWCECTACASEFEKYGTHSAAVIKMVNRMSDEFNEWIKTNDEGIPHDRLVDFLFFAYGQTLNAPVIKTKRGYSAIDQEVICRDSVRIWFASTEIDYNVSIEDDVNKDFKEALKGWSALAKEIHVWAYQTNFYNFLMPFNTFETTLENYRFYKKMDVASVFDESQGGQERPTAFNELKIYLTSRIGWDVNLDMNQLILRYFDNVFGPAADKMYQYYTSMIAWQVYLRNYHNVKGNIFGDLGDRKYHPKQLLDTWKDIMNDALEAIEGLKNVEPESYRLKSQAIRRESIYVRYILLTLYTGEYSDDTLNEMRKSFKSDVQELNITNITSWIPISSMWTTWQLY